MVLVCLIQGCTAVHKGDNISTGMSQLVIAEPLPINYKSEIAIARLSEVIHRPEITNEQRAKLYYDRGVIYDSVGLRALAHLDFTLALRLKADLVDAYNFLGIHFIQMQEFMQAYEAFDSALELSPEHEYAYLNRGIALYYGGRPALSLEDLNNFHQLQKDDPYRLLWIYIVEQSIDKQRAQQSLKEQAVFVNDNSWAKKIIHLYLNEIQPNEFIDLLTAGIKSNKALTERLCEAYFYLGKYHQMKGNDALAANFFKLTLSTNVYEFVEHRYAKLELDFMRAPLNKH